MNKLSIDKISLFLVLVLAFLLRFFHLGSDPISESEAANALQAFFISGGKAVQLNSQPGYVLLTSAVFYFLQSSEFLARFFPALAGSLLIVAPILFWKNLGRVPALLLALFFAIDPGLVFLSRTASGEILSITFMIFAIGGYFSGKPVFTGVFFSLALLSGSTAWFGLTVLLLVIIGLWVPGLRKKHDYFGSEGAPISKFPGWSWRKLIFSGSITLFLAGTLFMFLPWGINGIFTGLSNYLAGWGDASKTSFQALFASFLFYENLPVLLGLFAIIRIIIRRDSVQWFLVLGSISALFLLVIYPGRSVANISWSSIPLAALALKKLYGHYSLKNVERVPYFGMIGMTVIALVFGWLNFKGIFTTPSVDSLAIQLRIVSVVGAGLLILLSAALVAWGWSFHTALRSLLACFSLGLVLLNVSSIWHGFTAFTNLRQEIWFEPFVDQELFMNTVSDYERWNFSDDDRNIFIYNQQSDILKWTMRNNKYENVSTLPGEIKPSMLVTGLFEELSLAEQYAGQDFILLRRTLWDEMSLTDWMRWFFTRNAPVRDETIILWVRIDQFPGYETNENQ